MPIRRLPQYLSLLACLNLWQRHCKHAVARGLLLIAIGVLQTVFGPVKGYRPLAEIVRAELFNALAGNYPRFGHLCVQIERHLNRPVPGFLGWELLVLSLICIALMSGGFWLLAAIAVYTIASAQRPKAPAALMEQVMRLGDRLRAFREAKKLSQGDIERRVGLNAPTSLASSMTILFLPLRRWRSWPRRLRFLCINFSTRERSHISYFIFAGSKTAEEIAFGRTKKEARFLTTLRRLLAHGQVRLAATAADGPEDSSQAGRK